MIKLLLSLISAAVAASGEPLAKGIQDNSFFIEEAYNQEPGVVQHILNIPVFFSHGEKEITPSFTQEWPIFSQTHQFSYTVPYTFEEDQNGFADVRLNYRLQALMESDCTPAFAPRFSFVLPTGDADKAVGRDRVGYEINLPFSKILSDRWTLHFNAGGSLFPNVRDRDLWNYNVGGSAIYALSKNFNLMLESVAVWEGNVDSAAVAASAKETVARNVDRTVTAVVSPGARYAFNLPNAQLVVGVAVPIGLTSESPDYGLFFYLSFEHPFMRVSSNESK